MRTWSPTSVLPGRRRLRCRRPRGEGPAPLAGARSACVGRSTVSGAARTGPVGTRTSAESAGRLATRGRSARPSETDRSGQGFIL